MKMFNITKLRKLLMVGSCSVALICSSLLFPKVFQASDIVASSIYNTKSSWEWYSYGVDMGMNITYDEYIMICSLVQGETSGAEVSWAELVACVVYNRVISNEFPNTIYGVLSQKNQFDNMERYYSGISINDNTYEAVANVFSGNAYNTIYNLDGATYYINPDILPYTTYSWFYNNLKMTYDTYYYNNYGYCFHHVFFRSYR